MSEVKLVEQLWNYLCLNMKPEKSDCILGLGTYDLHIPERCAGLYHQGYADIVIFSGGLGKTTGELWSESEAEKFEKIALEKGVPKNKIYIENKSTNSGENFEFVNKIIEKNNLNINSFLLVHKPYMERRAYATFKRVNPTKKCCITSQVISIVEYFKQYEDTEVSSKEIINNIVGDFQRVKVYGENGWQIKQEIPDEMWKAYEKLVKLGYDKYVIKGE